jgi:hypothetical protein
MVTSHDAQQKTLRPEPDVETSPPIDRAARQRDRGKGYSSDYFAGIYAEQIREIGKLRIDLKVKSSVQSGVLAPSGKNRMAAH